MALRRGHFQRRMWRLSAAGFSLLACVGIAQAATRPRPGAGQLHQQIERILARPEYQQQVPKWWSKFAERVTDVLGRILDFLFGNLLGDSLQHASPALRWALVIILIGALAALVAHILLTIQRAFQPPRPSAQASSSSAGQWLSPEQLREAAFGAASAGDYQQALRYLYASLIGYLDRQGIVVYDHTATNWDYLRQVRDRPQIAEQIRRLNNIADGVWYGRRVLDRAGFERCVEWVERAWRLAGPAGGGED